MTMQQMSLPSYRPGATTRGASARMSLPTHTPKSAQAVPPGDGPVLRSLPPYRPKALRASRGEGSDIGAAVGVTPQADDRLSGPGGAELASRLPGYTRASDTRELPEAGAAVSADAPVTPGDVSGGGPAQSGLEAALAGWQKLYTDPVEDENGRLRSAARMLMRPVQVEQGEGLGSVVGKKLAQGINGLINPRLDEQVDRREEIGRQGEVVKAQMEVEKVRQARLDAATERRLKQAQAKNYEALPGYRNEEQRRKEEAEKSKDTQKNRALIASVFNRLDVFDPSDPANQEMVESLRGVGLPVVEKKSGQQLRFVQDMKTGDWSVIAGDKGTGTATSAPVTGADGAGQLSTTSTSQMTAIEGEKNRASRERVAKWQIGARKEIAGMQQQLQRDRMSMSADQFSKRYPGAGKTISMGDVIRLGEQMKMLPEDAYKSAVRQGYKVEN